MIIENGYTAVIWFVYHKFFDIYRWVYVLLPTRPETVELVNVALAEKHHGLTHAVQNAKSQGLNCLFNNRARLWNMMANDFESLVIFKSFFKYMSIMKEHT